MPLSPRCECGHMFFMHHGAGNHGDEAGGCGDTVKGDRFRKPCLCKKYTPAPDGTEKA